MRPNKKVDFSNCSAAALAAAGWTIGSRRSVLSADRKVRGYKLFFVCPAVPGKTEMRFVPEVRQH